MDLFEEEIFEVLSSFEKHSVDYLLVGGFAVNYYGYNRTTVDLDLWIDVSEENKGRLVTSLDELGYDIEDVKSINLSKQPPIDIPIAGFKIELINYLGDILDFREAYESSEKFELNDITIRVLHINHLIDLKESSNRPKDLLDAEELRKIRKRN